MTGHRYKYLNKRIDIAKLLWYCDVAEVRVSAPVPQSQSLITQMLQAGDSVPNTGGKQYYGVQYFIVIDYAIYYK